MKPAMKWSMALLMLTITTSQQQATANALPANASFVYTTPALYLNLTVGRVLDLGNLSTGGKQLLGPILSGHFYSEPGFELQFTGKVIDAADFLTADPGTDGIARPACVGAVVPDNGDSKFLFRIDGIDTSSELAREIFTTPSTTAHRAVPYGYSYSVWRPTFYGGGDKYKVLQNSMFVASETVSDSSVPNAFLVGMKISKIWPLNTTVTIGEEFDGE